MDALIDTITCGDSQHVLKTIPDNSVDLLATDPPYGLAFMGKDWDRALPSIDIWKECFRVLKPGAWAFVMSIPRLDCLSRMAGRLMKAGFDVSFTPLFWAYASGFPKAMNISKAVDKKLGAKREIIGRNPNDRARRDNALSDYGLQGGVGKGYVTRPSTDQAQQLEGAYGGFQPKPAVEVIIVAMKPLNEKTYVEQALANQKGVTWLDDCRIPYRSGDDKPKDTVAPGWSAQDKKNAEEGYRPKQYTTGDFDWKSDQKGRFPANLVVSDDVLNDGQNFNKGGSIHGAGPRHNRVYGDDKRPRGDWLAYGDAGSFSRYFDLDQWWEDRLTRLPGSVQKVFPFLIVPKAGKREKNEGCEQLEGHLHETGARTYDDVCANCGKKLVGDVPYRCVCEEKITQRRVTKGNFHPTVKPLKLMSYLITLGSQEGDVVLDPFVGSGTTALAARLLGRRFVVVEIRPEYVELAKARLGTLDAARGNAGL